MKNQTFGIEIETTGCSRSKVAKIIADYFGTESYYIGTGYKAYGAKDTKDRVWKCMYDSSIISTGAGVCEIVSPILTYDDMDDLQEIVRLVRQAGAYATIISSPGDMVPVVVWNINDMHERSLDRYEGFPRFYYKEHITVRLESSQIIKAMVYIMFDEAKVGKPSMQYLTTIAEGYLDNKLDMRIFEESISYNEYELA